VEPICVPAFSILIVGVSGAIYLSVNTTTDCGRSFIGLSVEGTVDTVLLKTKITINLKKESKWVLLCFTVGNKWLIVMYGVKSDSMVYYHCIRKTILGEVGLSA